MLDAGLWFFFSFWDPFPLSLMDRFLSASDFSRFECFRAAALVLGCIAAIQFLSFTYFSCPCRWFFGLCRIHVLPLPLRDLAGASSPFPY